MKKIDIVVGARPNYIKAFPVYEALNKTGNFDLRLINTGQHYDDNMSNIFFRQLGMKKPDVDLSVGSDSHAVQTAKIMIKIEKEFLRKKPDLLIVFGDVNSTIAAALTAAKLNIPIAHIEAGLRSFDRSMPEEVNRILTDQISTYLFTTSPEAEKNLLLEGKIKKQIYFVGNTMIDSLVKFEKLFNCSDLLIENKLIKKEYILVTLHRPSNVDNPSKLKDVANSLNMISEKTEIIWPIHPRTWGKLNQYKILLNERINITKPKGYLEFMGLQKNAKFIITDSGGVQEESTYFGIPCFTVRDNTERPITVNRGSNILVGSDFTKLFDVIIECGKKEKRRNLLPEKWDGASSERIASIIINNIL
jgi:UDP-N-acetylglucosamine 2-epimerase (non-hydrolysing)